jgi:hypothetical protein
MLERSSLGAARSEVEVAFAVQIAYYDILRATNELQIRQETVERLEDYATLLKCCVSAESPRRVTSPKPASNLTTRRLPEI